MSAILDALRKLEAEAEAVSGSYLPERRSAGYAGRSRKAAAGLVFLAAAGIVLVFLLGAAVWHVAVLSTEPQEGRTSVSKEDYAGKQAGAGDSGIGDAPSAKPASGSSSGQKAQEQKAPEPAQEQKTPEPAQAQTAAEPEVMQGGPLTLQAVSWSGSPDRRFAVINGRICREDEKVDGYRILEIKTEGVVVESKGERRRLVFSGK